MASLMSPPFIISSACTIVPLKLTSLPSSSPKLPISVSSHLALASFLASLLSPDSAFVATTSDSNSCSGLIDLSTMRLNSTSLSWLSLVELATQLRL